MEDPVVASPADDSLNMSFGCVHYRRRCKIRAPCCDQIFTCRHCHNEAVSLMGNSKDHHELVRRDVKHVICSICDTEQQVAQNCVKCGIKMGKYFCDICKFYDDDTSKQQFHCDDCGICRVGGRDNYFHCENCGTCYQVSLRNNHSCVENSMKHHCPICREYLFDSVKSTNVMRCGHTMHTECLREMTLKNHYRCPICSKSLADMSTAWRSLAVEIEANPMPQEYRYEVSILCNDCNKGSTVLFHFLGHICCHCSSCNTRVIQRL